jgi:hypothetical protein
MNTDMDKTLVSLRAELRKSTDSVVKRWLYNAIHCIMKAVEQQKLVDKKAERKLKQEAKDQADAMKEALNEIEKKRHRIK